MCAIDFPERFQDWELDPKLLFDCATEKKVTAGRVRGSLEREARTCDALVLWLDCDREEKIYVLKSWMRSFHECEEEEACETSTAPKFSDIQIERRERDEKFSETE